MTDRSSLQRTTNRVAFDLGKKRYGHHQQPAVLASDDDRPKATVMTDDELHRYLEAIRDELDRQGKPLFNRQMQACRERKARAEQR